MAARAAAVKVKSDLRVILKYAKSLPSSSANAMHDHVLSQFKLGSHETDKQKIKVLRWQARDAASLVDSTMKRRELIDIYAGEKMSQVERMKLSAHRVGLRMPANYGDEAAAAADEVADARYKEKMDDRTFSRNPM